MVGHSTKEALTDGCGHKRMDIEPTEVQRNHMPHRIRRLAPTSGGRSPTNPLARLLDEQ
jgi:hypothetical protein